MNCYEYPVTVQYDDLSEDRLCSPVSVLRMMQEAAARSSAACGFGPDSAEKRGVVWALGGWRLELRRRCPWNSALTVRTWPRALETHTSDRDFLVLDSAGAPVAAATSRWLLLDTRTGHVARITPEIQSAYTLCPERAVPGDAPSPLSRAPGDARTAASYTVLRRDIDTLHHMNNLHYLSLAREALPPELSHLPFTHFEILYKRQIKLGETVDLRYALEEGRHVVELRSQDGRRTHALLWFS